MAIAYFKTDSGNAVSYIIISSILGYTYNADDIHVVDLFDFKRKKFVFTRMYNTAYVCVCVCVLRAHIIIINYDYNCA